MDEILSYKEREALLALVQTFEALQVARARLNQAERNFTLARKSLTEAYFDTGSDGEEVSVLPKNGIIEWKGRNYTLKIDIEGDHLHEIHYSGDIIHL